MKEEYSQTRSILDGIALMPTVARTNLQTSVLLGWLGAFWKNWIIVVFVSISTADRIRSVNQLTTLKYMKHGEERTINIISKAAHNWVKIADLVTDDHHVVDNLKDLHRGKNEEALRQLLIECFIDNAPVGGYSQDWNGLTRLLSDAKLGTLASDIKDAITSH